MFSIRCVDIEFENELFDTSRIFTRSWENVETPAWSRAKVCYGLWKHCHVITQWQSTHWKVKKVERKEISEKK